jgi:hypothetical protein
MTFLEKENNMDWIKKHTDTVIILTAFASSVLWMNGKFNDVDKRFNNMEKDMAVVKAVLILKNIMPAEMAKNQEKQHDD